MPIYSLPWIKLSLRFQAKFPTIDETYFTFEVFMENEEKSRFEVLLEGLNWSKKALADRLGLSRVAVSKWGSNPPRYAMAYLELAYKVQLLARSI